MASQNLALHINLTPNSLQKQHKEDAYSLIFQQRPERTLPAGRLCRRRHPLHAVVTGSPQASHAAAPALGQAPPLLQGATPPITLPDAPVLSGYTLPSTLQKRPNQSLSVWENIVLTLTIEERRKRGQVWVLFIFCCWWWCFGWWFFFWWFFFSQLLL